MLKPGPVYLTLSNGSSYSLFSLRTVGVASEAASTSDAAMDCRLTGLGESSQESLDLPSTPDLSRIDGNGIDDHDSEENGSMDGISDDDVAENGHINGTDDRDTRENGHMDGTRDHECSMEETSDHAAVGGQNEMQLFEIDKEGTRGKTMDIQEKGRKTKKDLEVSYFSDISKF